MNVIKGTSDGYINMSNDIVAAMTGTSVLTVAVSSGGTGYTVGDILTFAGGTSTIAATCEVTSVSGGVINGIRMVNAGVYSVAPSSPNSATGGTGSGASLTITTGTHGWTVDRDTAYSGSEREVILDGDGDGTDSIKIGWRTFSDAPGDYYNWELHYFTGYVGGADWDEQPGISPGLFDGATAEVRSGSYFYLDQAGTTITWWLYIDHYRITIVAQPGVSAPYFNMSMGWGNRVATESEYPQPLYVSGSGSAYDISHGDSPQMSGLSDPWRSNVTAEGDDAGPMFVRTNDGTNHSVWNCQISSSTRTQEGKRNVLPAGRPDAIASVSTPKEDKFTYGAADVKFEDIISLFSLTGPLRNLRPLPGSTDPDTYWIIPCLVVFSEPSHQVVMEIPDVYWCSGFGAIGAEDRHIQSGIVYRVFPNCNRSAIDGFLAIREF